jgi:hypothetical protein
MTDTLLLSGLNNDSDSAKALLIDWLYWKTLQNVRMSFRAWIPLWKKSKTMSVTIH